MSIAKPWAIVLSGASCAGKTSIAHALSDHLSTSRRLFLHVEADRLYPHVPAAYESPSGATGLGYAIHKAIAAFLEEGFDVIVDGALPYGDATLLLDAICLYDQFRLCIVGIHCSLDELDRRERSRPDRVDGWARRQAADIHVDMTYNVEIDTTSTSAADNAAVIANYVTSLDADLRGPVST